MVRDQSMGRRRPAVLAVGFLLISTVVLSGSANAQKVDGVQGKTGTAPVNLQMTPTDAFVRIRGWSLPAPVLPLAILGSWGGKGTISGAGAVTVPQGQISAPQQFQFPRDINGEQEQMIVSLNSRGDWDGVIDPLDGEAMMNMPMTLRIEAHHVRMVNIPWPGGWIYGNIDCTVPLDFGPMTASRMDPPDPVADPPPVIEGSRYSPDTGQFSVIDNSMTTGGFNCSHPDIGAGKVEDELNEAVAIPAPAGRIDARFNMTFLEGGNFIRPQPAIRPAFTSLPGAPLAAVMSAKSSYAKAGVLRYLWDLDGNGKQETVTPDADVTHSFPAAGSHPVGMRIIDKDGDLSAWTYRMVEVSEASGSGVPELAPLKVSPRTRYARPGSKARFKVRVKNSGPAAATGARLCVTGAKHSARMVKVPKCRYLGRLAPGQSKPWRLKVKVSGKARPGRRLKLKFHASAEPGQKVLATGRIKVTGGPGRK